MSFYGKIYEQMGNIFNRIGFKNKIEKVKKDFPSNEKIKDFVLQANSEGDKVTFSSGNSWITLVETPNTNDPLICSIYHQPAQEDLPNTTFATISELDQGYFFNLTSEEQEELKKSNQYINFGDKITIDSLQYDEAGHIYGVEQKDYILAEIPNLNEILEANDNINYLLEVVGKEDPDKLDGTLLERTSVLEEALTEINKIVDDAAKSATNAQIAAEAAKAEAEAAAASATSADRVAADAISTANDAMDQATNASNIADNAMSAIGTISGLVIPALYDRIEAIEKMLGVNNETNGS